MPIRPRVLLLTLPLVAVTLALVVGCGSDRDDVTSSSISMSTTTVPDQLPTRDPDIGGGITSISGRTLLVEAADTTTPYTYDRASLTVPADAPIGTCGPGDGREYGSFDDLSVGSYVVAWIDGPVAESYPVQATASAVALVCG